MYDGGVGRLALLVVMVGCYSPSVAPGGLCGTDGACPAGLMCFDGRCLPEPPDSGPTPVDGAVDARRIDAPISDAPIDAPPALGAWGTPVAVMGVDQSGSESDPTFTPNRLTIVFARNSDLFMGVRASTNDAFTVTALTILNSSAEERGPEISPDGMTLYFASDRHLVDDHEVFVSTWSGVAWSAPVLEPTLSIAGGVGDFAFTPNMLAVLIERNDVFYRSTRATTTSAWSTPAPVTTPFGALSNPAGTSLDADADLYFHAGSNRDLYVARWNGTAYGAPSPITELNSSLREAAPSVSADERYMMFERNGEIVETSR